MRIEPTTSRTLCPGATTGLFYRKQQTEKLLLNGNLKLLKLFSWKMEIYSYDARNTTRLQNVRNELQLFICNNKKDKKKIFRFTLYSA